MESKQYSSWKTLLCRVCGDIARGNNFQVVTCMSCKSFFRRNALLPWGKIFHCREKNKCIIRKKTRSQCGACRLKKCFLVGMNPNLIRQITRHNFTSINFQYSQIINRNKALLFRFQSSESLKNDSTTLTSEQWTLLSNIIHSYNEQNPILKIKYLFEKQSSLPLKLRFKPIDTLNLIGAFIQSIQPTIECLFHFQRSSFFARQILIKNNFEGIGILHGLFGLHEIDAFNDPVFLSTCHELYGSVYLTRMLSLCNRLQSDLVFVKTLIFVLIFSTNFSIVNFNNEQDIRIILNPIELIQIQNIYINILWKYMIYQYGFNKAVQCLNSLIKNILDILYIMEDLNNIKKHNQMINNIVKQTTYSLIIQN